MTIERLDHVNLVVDDLGAMVAFYRDVLGLRLTREVTIRGDWIRAVTGLEEAEAQVVYLEAPAGSGLELICYRTPRGTRPHGLEKPNVPGIRHVAFGVDDLETTVGTLRAAGARLLSEIQLVPGEQVEFAGRRKRIVYCLDPEGNLVELCDFTRSSNREPDK